MTDTLPEVPDAPMWFVFSGHKDTQNEIDESINSLSGKTILSAIKVALLSHGWSESMERPDSEIFAEDWGWCLFLLHEGALVLLGTHVLSGDLTDDEEYREYLDCDWVDCGLTVEHSPKRSLGDLFRGRNKADPKVREMAFRSVWETISGLNYVRELSVEPPEDR